MPLHIVDGVRLSAFTPHPEDSLCNGQTTLFKHSLSQCES